MFNTPFAFMAAPAGGATLLLDDYPGALYAYSVRKLRSAYAGSALRVRRSSDNAEQDIGFVGNDLDTSALTTFCSGTNGFVKIWYDQTANATDAAQTTTANQPTIVSSGVINTVSGIGSATPAINMNNWLEIPNVISALPSGTVFGVYKTTGLGAFWNYNDNLGGTTHHPFFTDIYEGFGSTQRPGFPSDGLLESQHLYTVMSETNNRQAFVNGINKFTTATNTVSWPVPGLYGVRIGADTVGSTYPGFYQEHIFYPSNNLTNRTGIENNQNDYFQAY